VLVFRRLGTLMLPETDQIVRVRSRQYLVDGVQAQTMAQEPRMVPLCWLEYGAQGEIRRRPN
jgi:hypothetical protein